MSTGKKSNERPPGKLHNQWMPNEKQRVALRILFGIGFTVDDAAAGVGVSGSTLENALKKDATLAKERETAKAYLESQLSNKLVGKALIGTGDTAALRFLLQTKFKWRTTERIEITGANGRPLFEALNLDMTPAAVTKRVDKMLKLLPKLEKK